MKKIGLVILGIGVLLIGIISFSKEEKKVLVEEEINNSNTSLVFMLQDEEGNYNKSEELPSSGYSFNTSKSVCSNNTTPTWEDNKLYLNNLNKNGTSCYLYFDRMGAKDTILLGKEIKIRILPFTTSTTVTDTTTGTIYKAEDDDGDTYYFAGNPQDNWVKFAGYYWRIIRINGDGSIRLIYSGDEASGPVTTGRETQIQMSAFNSNHDRSEYVGYMYSLDEQHGNTTNSDIKTVVDEWYNKYLINYADYISKEAGFCGDREMASGHVWSSQPTSNIHYASYGRLIQSGNSVNPTFKCSNSNDLYTVSDSSKGNKKLSSPIGLITADEVVMVGLSWRGSAVNNYLYTDQEYWTMTPTYFKAMDFYTEMFNVGLGSLIWSGSTARKGVRPVINLARDVTLSGTGTASDPYIVEGAE